MTKSSVFLLYKLKYSVIINDMKEKEITMNKNYYTNFINFFKKHGLYNEEIFNYIARNTTSFDYYDEELMNIRGIYYKYNELKELTSFKLYLPYIDSEITAFMNIRPYIQAIYAYTKLGKKHKANAECETIALYFEKLYLQENPNQQLEEYLNNIHTSIKEQKTEKKYKIALNAESDLKKYIEENNPSFNELQRKAKRLSRKYRRKV